MGECQLPHPLSLAPTLPGTKPMGRAGGLDAGVGAQIHRLPAFCLPWSVRRPVVRSKLPSLHWNFQNSLETPRSQLYEYSTSTSRIEPAQLPTSNHQQLGRAAADHSTGRLVCLLQPLWKEFLLFHRYLCPAKPFNSNAYHLLLRIYPAGA